MKVALREEMTWESPGQVSRVISGVMCSVMIANTKYRFIFRMRNSHESRIFQLKRYLQRERRTGHTFKCTNEMFPICPALPEK